MSENTGVPSALDAFRTGHERGITAFNRAEYKRALAGTSPDLEFHPDPSVPEGRIVHGRAKVIRYFEDTRSSFPDWRVDPVEYTDMGDGRFIVRSRLGGTRRVSGIAIDAEIFHVWEVRDGVIVRLREFLDRDRALADLGLQE